MLKRVRLYTPKAMLQQTWESFLLELKNLLEKYKIFGYIEDDEIAITHLNSEPKMEPIVASLQVPKKD